MPAKNWLLYLSARHVKRGRLVYFLTSPNTKQLLLVAELVCSESVVDVGGAVCWGFGTLQNTAVTCQVCGETALLEVPVATVSCLPFDVLKVFPTTVRHLCSCLRAIVVLQLMHVLSRWARVALCTFAAPICKRQAMISASIFHANQFIMLLRSTGPDAMHSDSLTEKQSKSVPGETVLA